MWELREDRASPPAPVSGPTSQEQPHMEAGWNGALARLDTNSRTAAAHDLHASAGNAAVQRMLSRDDQGARRDAAGGDLQRAIEDEEMPDEAAAG